MAQLKKLQSDIDKGLKKVDEGVEEYNRLKEAHHRASQPNQKEKLEETLKAQIKKLQIADKNVKDKTALTQGKNKIEALMDHFKEFERESKTKRFSQVGLNKEDRADPEEQKRREMISWIQEMLSNLEKEFDELTAEDQQLMSKKPSKNSKEEANMSFNKRILESHRWHITKLEQLQRKLNNEDVDVENLDALKDSLEQYIDPEMNQRSPEAFIDYNEVYEDFNLEEVEDYLAAGRDKDDEEEKEELPPPVVKKEEPKPKEPAKHKAPSISVRPEEKAEKAILPKQIQTRTVPQPHPGPSQAAPSHALPTPVPAAAAAAVPAAQQPPKQPPTAPAPPPQAPPQRPVMADPSALPTVPPPSKPPPTPQAEAIHEPPNQPPPPPPSNAPPPAPVAVAKKQPAGQPPMGQRPAVPPAGPPPPPNEAPPVPRGPDPAMAEGPEPQLAYADIPPLTAEQERNHALFEASGRFLPLPSDQRKSRRYSQMTPYTHKDAAGRAVYPEEPSRSFDDPAVFERYDPDTLFFIFYFQQGTYQQYLAAKELKKLAWRYHTKFLTWFQRHEEPRMTAPEFERGAYVFFDYETQWQQRVKNDFTFEYAWLESSDV